jgi:integrase
MSTRVSKQRIKWSIKFYPVVRNTATAEKPTNNKIPIYMWITFGKDKRVQFYTRELINNINQWDDHYIERVKNDRDHFRPVKSQVTNSTEINERLEELAKETRRLIELANNHEPPIELTAEYLKAELKAWIDPDTDSKAVHGISVVDALAAYKEYVTLNMAPKTAQGLEQVYYNINAFIDTQKSKYVSLSEIDQAFVNGFESFLITTTGQHKKKLSHNTYCKNLKILRSFLKWCTDKKKCYEGNVKISYKENESEILFLTLEEIDALEKVVFEDKKLERIRDVFVFGCFTGLRYGDIKKLKKSDLRNGHIHYFEQKKNATTSKSIKLVTKTLALIEKYKDWPGEMLLPAYANPNRKLKDVFKAAGINQTISIVKKFAGGRTEETIVQRWEKATSHMERKSFITNSLAKNMPPAILMSITGHVKDSKAFKRYYEINDKHRDDAMDDAFGKL